MLNVRLSRVADTIPLGKMEKRLFLAVALSFMVLYLWSMILPKPTPPTLVKNSQIIVDKEFTNKSIDILEPPPPSESAQKLNEEIVALKSDKVEAEFSNIGGAIKRLRILDYNKSLPLTNLMVLNGYENMPFIQTVNESGHIEYTYENAEIKITKIYRLVEGQYAIQSEVKFENKIEMSKMIPFELSGMEINTSNLDNKDQMFILERALYEYAIKSNVNIFRKASAYKFAKNEGKAQDGPVNWIAFRDRYFAVIVKPLYQPVGFSVNPIDENRLALTMRADQFSLSPREIRNFSYLIYAGPEKSDLLKSYDLDLETIDRKSVV